MGAVMPAGTRDGRRRLYLDFDGYFAAVEEQATPALHGRPVAVLPLPGGADLRDLGERGGEAPRGGDGDRGGRGAQALSRDRPGGPAPGALRADAAPDRARGERRDPDRRGVLGRRAVLRARGAGRCGGRGAAHQGAAACGGRAAGDVLDGGGVEPVACEGGLGDGQAGRAHGARCAAGPPAGSRPRGPPRRGRAGPGAAAA